MSCCPEQEFEESGTDLAQALTQKEAMARKKAAMSNDVAKALARLSSGLYIVTAAHNGAQGAMVGAWTLLVALCIKILSFILCMKILSFKVHHLAVAAPAAKAASASKPERHPPGCILCVGAGTWARRC